MSLKGVRQLKELLIRYSDYDGSSKGAREWIRGIIITQKRHIYNLFP